MKAEAAKQLRPRSAVQVALRDPQLLDTGGRGCDMWQGQQWGLQSHPTVPQQEKLMLHPPWLLIPSLWFYEE